MRQLPRLSPSGVSLWLRCQQRWWLDKVARIRGPQTSAQAIGTAIHARIEEYLLTGEWPEEDALTKRAKSAQRFLTPMRQAVAEGRAGVEAVFEQPACDAGVLEQMQAAIDVYHDDDMLLELAEEHGFALPTYCKADYIEAQFVNDHKSTGNIHGPWLLKPAELRHDDQMLFYGYLAFRDDPPETFEVQHTYIQSRGAVESRATRVGTSWQNAIVTAKKFARNAVSMRIASAELQPDALTGNLQACGDYNSLCPHVPYCPAYQAVHGDGGGGKHMDNTGFLANIKAMKGGGAKAPAQTKAPEPEGGEANPPDSPGTGTPTESQVDEMLGHIVVAFSGEDEQPTRQKIAAWLTSRRGKELLTEVGLGVGHIPRIIMAYSKALQEEDVDDVEPLIDPASVRPDPTATVADDDDDDIEEEDDVDKANAEALAHQAQELEDEDDLEAAIASLEDPGMKAVAEWLQNQGGAAKINDSGLASIIREAIDAGRLTRKARNEFLGKMNDIGIVDYSATHVFFPGMNPAAGGGPLPRPQPAQRREGPAPKRTDPKPQEELELLSDKPPTFASTEVSWASVFLLVGAVTATLPSVDLEQYIAPYIAQISSSAEDKNGRKTGHWLLDAYNGGPAKVAALVSAAVAAGKLKPIPGCILVRRGHPLEPLVRTMFPEAQYIQGV